MLSIGLEVTGRQVVRALADVTLMGRALAANLICVPLLGLVLVWLFPMPPDAAAGVLILAAAPGAPFAPPAPGDRLRHDELRVVPFLEFPVELSAGELSRGDRALIDLTREFDEVDLRKAGLVRWSEPLVHTVENIGETEGHVISVELK